MLYNELLLVGKRLQVPEGLIRYNVFAVHSGCGIDPKNKTKFCFRVSVSENFEFTCHPDEYMDGNVLKNTYALQYRNGPQDSSGRSQYYFGDLKVKIKNAKPGCSFEEFSEDIKTPFHEGVPVPEYMIKFKEAISKDTSIKLLWEFIIDRAAMVAGNESNKKFSDIIIHFDLYDVLQVHNWNELPGCLDTMDDLYLEYAKKEEIFKVSPDNDSCILTRSFLPMIATGDDKNDIQFPGFDLNNRYKSFCVDSKTLRTILYHAKIMKDLTLPLFSTDPYKFQLVPSGSYSPSELISFIDRVSLIRTNMFKKKEGDITDNLEVAESNLLSDEVSDLFLGDAAVSMDQIIKKTSDTITSFDLILIRDETKVVINVSEINNVSKSSLLINLRRIDKVASDIRDKHNLKKKPSMVSSFYDIHRSIKKGEKYQQKYIRFLLANIRGIYYGDKDLAGLFIEHALKDIRNGEKSNFFLKISYEFIESLNVKGPLMLEEQSVKLGGHCAALACPVTFVIRSFKKGEIGTLNRRITNLNDVLSFANNMMLILIRHDGEAAGSKRISTDALGVHSSKIYEIAEEMKTKKIDFDKEAFITAFLDRLNKENFWHTKKDEA